MRHADPEARPWWRPVVSAAGLVTYWPLAFIVFILCPVVFGWFPPSVLTPAEWLVLVAAGVAVVDVLADFVCVVRRHADPPLVGTRLAWWMPLSFVVYVSAALNVGDGRSWRMQVIGYCAVACLLGRAASFAWGRLHLDAADGRRSS